MILAPGPLDVNPTAVLLLQPLFLLLSPVGGTAVMLSRTRTSQVSLSSPSMTPLPHLPHLWVVPVWGLTVVHRPWCARHGVVNMVNNRESSKDDCTCEADRGDAPRPWTHACNRTWRGQRGQGTTSIGSVLYVERLTARSTAAARKCLLITRKIMIPPPNSRDPPDGPPYFAKKTFPLTAGTHQLHLRTQGSA